MYSWYVVNTYSGHENKVKANLEHRRQSMSQEERIHQIVVPTEQVVETKDGELSLIHISEPTRPY